MRSQVPRDGPKCSKTIIVRQALCDRASEAIWDARATTRSESVGVPPAESELLFTRHKRRCGAIPFTRVFQLHRLYDTSPNT
jgi:hypothetical protein